MGLNNCKLCGKLHLKGASDYCQGCQKEQAATYRMVREFVKSHPSSTLLDVHLHTGVPISRLLDMQKESYLLHES
ncbi:hypothetical protein B5M42_013510 [Paenibacillus athensensis]|uniref:Flagellar protein n=1 Tax=Paenibacillus athensensis TaxID=1967502 RepID=A0A4Y8Q626_9BACL|nr:hypothetical protein [Paenibacillus athensensis]MCD1259851.1 hypothetical protein [Paenibacillus athensensis]